MSSYEHEFAAAGQFPAGAAHKIGRRFLQGLRGKRLPSFVVDPGALPGYHLDICPLADECGDPRLLLRHRRGAIGMPANDGTKQTWYSLLQSPAPGLLRISTRRLSYAASATAAKMAAAGLCGGYERALTTSLWPSLDVLPASEKQATGSSLRCDPVQWSTGAAPDW